MLICTEMSQMTLFFFLILFIYLWLCWVFISVRGLSPVVASGGHSSLRCAGLSPSRPLLLRSTGSRRAGSAIMTHGPSRSAACGIFPDQGSNPCPLHWQADSQPLRHQGSPQMTLLQALFSSFHFCETCWAFLLEDPGSTFPFPGLSWCCLLSSKKKLSPACSHILSSICSPSGCEFGCKLTRAHLSNQFL